MINFDCDNVILCLYRGGSGGKFLVNNLGLSDDAFFQHIKLAIYQLKGKFDKQKKIKFIEKKLSEIKNNEWTDLELDDEHFFGVLSEEIDYLSEEQYLNAMNLRSEVLNEVISSGKYFFVLSHDYQTFLRHKKLWKNSKVIILTESFFFTKLRNHRASLRTFVWGQIVKEHEFYLPPFIPHLGDVPKRFMEKITDQSKEYVKEKLTDPIFLEQCSQKYEKAKLKYIWSVLRKNEWPQREPQCIQEYVDYPKELRDDIQKVFNEKSKEFDPNHKYPDEIINAADYLWDVSWYFSEDDTSSNLEKLYNKLNLKDYDEKISRHYYKVWFDKINEMSKISRNY